VTQPAEWPIIVAAEIRWKSITSPPSDGRPLDRIIHERKITVSGGLQMAADPFLGDAAAILNSLLDQYEEFLIATNIEEESLVGKFLNSVESRELMNASKTFGDLMFDALTEIGGGSPFHRMLVV
jgi:hypothetical protein